MLQIFMFFHILAVAMMFSAMTLEIAGFERLHRSTTLAQARVAIANFPLVSPLMVLGSLLLIVAGSAMVYLTGFGWTPAWIGVTAALMIVLSMSGPLVNGRRGNRIFKLASDSGDGPITSELQRARSDVVLNYSIFLSACELVAALFMMTTKPELLPCVITVALAAVVAGIPTVLVLRRSALAVAR